MLPPFFYTGLVPSNSEPQNSPIYLAGMMGAGKSTVGRELAARLGYAFLDTDSEVERTAGRSIAEIFEHQGEAHFRALEAEAVEQASEVGAVVVALGGGAITQVGALDRLLARGRVVFLRVAPEILIERIGTGASRPLLAGLDRAAQVERLAALLAERLVHYERASMAVDASRKTHEVVDEIVAGLGLD